MKRLACLLFLIFMTLFLGAVDVAEPHRGGLDRYGCHHDRIRGGYHCHQGPLAGMNFSSQQEMLQLLEKRGPKPEEKPLSAPVPEVLSGQVVGVPDGDTIIVELAEARRETVRLIGIDAPEIMGPIEAVPYAWQATEFLEKLIIGKNVKLETDVEKRDSYGRLLAYVYREDGLFVNAAIMQEGYARALVIPPNVKHRDLFLKLEEEAKGAKRGMFK